MKNKKLLLCAVLLTASGCSLAHASSTTISTKYEQTFRDNQDYKVKFGVGHVFDNDVAIGFEHQRRWKDEISGRPDLAENLFGIGYTYRFGDDARWSLQPKIEYKFNPGSETMRPMIKVNYKVDDRWSLGARYRYEYQTYNEGGGERSRANRFDGYIGYALTDDIGLAWNSSYAYLLSDSGSMYTGEKDRWEHEFTVAYQVDASNSLALTYKRKDQINTEADYNPGKHNDALQLTYKYKF